MTILVILAVALGVVIAIVTYRLLTRPARKEYGRGPTHLKNDTSLSFEPRSEGYNPVANPTFRPTRSTPQPRHKSDVVDSTVVDFDDDYPRYSRDSMSLAERFGVEHSAPAVVSASYPSSPQRDDSVDCNLNDSTTSSDTSSSDSSSSSSDTSSSCGGD